MKKFKVVLGNSYWVGTLTDLARWAKQPTYNEFMRNRQLAAKMFFESHSLDGLL